eukprot:764006-Hanusia_phi.AAC.7
MITSKRAMRKEVRRRRRGRRRKRRRSVEIVKEKRGKRKIQRHQTEVSSKICEKLLLTRSHSVDLISILHVRALVIGPAPAALLVAPQLPSKSLSLLPLLLVQAAAFMLHTNLVLRGEEANEQEEKHLRREEKPEQESYNEGEGKEGKERERGERGERGRGRS